jgi:hypothetical protein
MAYTRGDSKQIIVGAASMFVSKSAEFDPSAVTPDLPDFVAGASYRDTLTDAVDPSTSDKYVRNVGYTMNGLELQFQPDFGEVQVDQLLDVAKLYKQGMQVNMNTAFGEATLENLLVAIAAFDSDLSDPTTAPRSSNPLSEPGSTGTARVQSLDLQSGALGACPVERGLVAVGPGTGDCAAGTSIERIYVAYRALSIENVTVSAKRDEPSMFEVSFRLLPANNGSYGKIVDRTVPAAS